LLEKIGPKRPLHRPWTYWELRMEDKKQVRLAAVWLISFLFFSFSTPLAPRLRAYICRALSGATTR
jgi:hypothetical protein